MRKLLSNGHVLTINPVDVMISVALFQLICRELLSAKIDLSKVKSVADIVNLDPTFVKDGALQLLASEELVKIVFKILEKSTLQISDDAPAQAISRATFNPRDMRGDFFPAAWEVIKENVVPFFENLDLSSFIPKSTSISGPQ